MCTLKAASSWLQEDIGRIGRAEQDIGRIGRAEQDIGRIGRSLIEVCARPHAYAAGAIMP